MRAAVLAAPVQGMFQCDGRRPGPSTVPTRVRPVVLWPEGARQLAAVRTRFYNRANTAFSTASARALTVPQAEPDTETMKASRPRDPPAV